MPNDTRIIILLPVLRRPRWVRDLESVEELQRLADDLRPTDANGGDTITFVVFGTIGSRYD